MARARSNSPRPSISIIVFSSPTGRARVRAISTEKRMPKTAEETMIRIRTIVVDRSVA